MAQDLIKCEWTSLVSDEFMCRWEEFIDPPARLKSEQHFLIALGKGRRLRVLDAGLGMGIEATFLAKQGYDVVGNDISPGFQRLAAEYAQKMGIAYKNTSADWRKLSSELGIAQFDLVFLLGNSFSLVESAEDRRLVARQLRAVCRQGGRLVIDQRNFDYILDNPEEALSSRFRFSGKFMFCGKRVTGLPVHVERCRVRFAYGGARSAPIGFLDMFPLRFGELVKTFDEAGFREAIAFSDFMPGHREGADFFQFVMR